MLINKRTTNCALGVVCENYS